MYYICQLKVEDLNHANHANHANVEAEVSLPHLKLPYFHFYYTNHKKEYRKELLVKREENLARKEKPAESN